MRQLWICPVLVSAFLFATPFPAASFGPDDGNAPQSFYVAFHFYSDALWESFEEILEVAQQGKDVRVRAIRISSTNSYCPESLVRAAERVLPNTTVKKIASSRDICSLSEKDVENALEAAKPKYISDPADSASETIVAQCGSGRRIFEFPFPAEVNLKALKREHPRVDLLWDIGYKVRSHVFGERVGFNRLSPEQEKQAEDLGTRYAPDLVSGKFDAAYSGYSCGDKKCASNYFAWLLGNYKGAPADRKPAPAELLNAGSLHLVKYVAPPLPPIAIAAHISGEVRLKIIADPQTGLVTSVVLVSGSPVLARTAIPAAQSWQFAPGASPPGPVEAILKFELHCADN